MAWLTGVEKNEISSWSTFSCAKCIIIYHHLLWLASMKCFLILSVINSYSRFCAFYGCSCLSFIEVCINYWYCQLQGNWKINDVYIIASLMIACRVWTCHFQDMNTTKVKVDIFPSKNHLSFLCSAVGIHEHCNSKPNWKKISGKWLEGGKT